MLGLLAWEIKPEKKWALDPLYGNFDGYYALCYHMPSWRTATRREIFECYNAAFARYRGVSHISFELFTDGRTARTRILKQLTSKQEYTFSGTFHSLCSAINSFFSDTAPERRNESVWILKHALSECQTWDKFSKYPQIGDVAQKYGFNDIELQPDFNKNKVYKNLQEVYELVLNQGPIHLQRASNVEQHIRKVCQDNGMGLLPQSEIILRKIDHTNQVLADMTELERSVASN